MSYTGSVSFPIVYDAHFNNALPTVAPLPTQGWAFLSGSSMSAPLVAAAAASLADVYSYTSPGALEMAVRSYATSATIPNLDFPAVPAVRMP